MPSTRNVQCRSNCCRCELAFGLGGWRVRNCLARGRRTSASRVAPSATFRRPASAFWTLCRFAASTVGDRKASEAAAARSGQRRPEHTVAVTDPSQRRTTGGREADIQRAGVIPGTMRRRGRRDVWVPMGCSPQFRWSFRLPINWLDT